MYVCFGNLSINTIEEKLGIKFSDEHKEFLSNTKEEKVSDGKNFDYKIPAQTWHAFDTPFQIHCGSKNMAGIITNILKQYMNEGCFPKEGAKVGITFETLEEEKFGYEERKFAEENNLEIYVVKEEVSGGGFYSRFFVVTNETAKGMLTFKELEVKHKENDYFTRVPNPKQYKKVNVYAKDDNGFLLEDEVGDYIVLNEIESEPIKRKRNSENIYNLVEAYVDGKFKNTEAVLWDGNPVKNLNIF